MMVLPVLDLLDGVVVRGVGGRREEYRPVCSSLTSSAEPRDVARAFRESLGLTDLYLADLDAIERGLPAWATYRELSAAGFQLWIDAGLRDIAATVRLLDSGAAVAVVGLETWPGPRLLADLIRQVEADRVVFSLDLKAGRPLGQLAAWESIDALEIGLRAIEAGVRSIIVLDLAQVGLEQGLSTLDLCRALKQANPAVRLITGGGIRNAEDLSRVAGESIDGVLVASALHAGRITRSDVESVQTDGPQPARIARRSTVLDP